jgi:predicted ArsR family transcriptional regulator
MIASIDNPRQPKDTKQSLVLAMLRSSEGATVAQIAEAMSWAPHTVRGFFAGLKKRQGIAVTAAESVRQVGPAKAGAKGSFTIYRAAE